MFSTQLNLVGRAVAGRPGRRPHADRGPLGRGRPARSSGPAADMARRRPLGSHVTVHGVPGSPRLTVVGVATSVTGRAQAWVTPAEIAALRAPGAPAVSADALPLRPARAAPPQVSADVAAGPGRAAARLAARRAVVADRQAAGHPVDRAVGAVHRRVRPDRARDGGADRGQRGQRRGGGGYPPDRRAEVASASRPAQVVAAYVLQVAIPAVAGAWPGCWPATCCPCRCSARPRGSTGWARWPCRPGSTWPCRWPCSA